MKSKDSSVESSVQLRIVKGARQYFFSRGLRDVTMDDLAQELGMSKKTLYEYFPSKTALVEAAILDKFHDVEVELEQITSEGASDFVRSLHLLLACIRRHTEELQPPFLRDVRRGAPEIFKLVEGRRRDLIQHYFGKFFKTGRKAGIIRKDIPARLVIEILLAAVQAIINPPKMADLGLTPKVAFTAIITVILEGVITEKGRSEL